MSTKLTKVQFNLQFQSHLTCLYNNCISAGQVLKIKPTIIVGFIFMTWPALIPNTRTKPLRSLGYHFTFNFNLTSLDFIKKNRPLANFILRTWPALIPQLLLRSSSLASTTFVNHPQ